ncbi:hypothetical protein C0J52_22058 [Blattella germanica]|nr:hypothetical protein C0J52_22058 [Blattella germanica]
MSLSIEVASDTATLNEDVYLMLLGIRQNLTVTPKACDSSDGFCPVKANTNPYQYTAEVYIPSNMPTVNGYIYWRLRDDADRSLVCYRVVVAIYDSLAQL